MLAAVQRRQSLMTRQNLKTPTWMMMSVVCLSFFFWLTCTDYHYAVISVNAKKKGRKGTLGNPVAVDDDGLLVDVEVQEIDIDDAPRTTREDKRQDVDNFFLGAMIKDMNGRSKKYRLCKICP